MDWESWMGHSHWNISSDRMYDGGVTVFKYLPERIDLDPLLGLDINQNVVTDKDFLNFTKKKESDVPDNDLIAEPFNEETWLGVLEKKQTV